MTGGPHGDAGVTGRKIIVDTYGGAGAPRRRRLLGQGPYQGRPFRELHGPLRREELRRRRPRPTGVQVQLAYAIGVADPVSVLVDTFGTARIDEERMSGLVREHFSLTPKGIIETLDLRRPIYRQTAAFGHFGRSEPDFTWERTDKAEALRRRGRAVGGDSLRSAPRAAGRRPSRRRGRWGPRRRGVGVSTPALPMAANTLTRTQ